MGKKPSPAQMRAMVSCQNRAPHTSTMPYADEARSWDACLRHGWMEYEQRDIKKGIQFNGYRLSLKGKELVKEYLKNEQA